jgi:hypothetical protein
MWEVVAVVAALALILSATHAGCVFVGFWLCYRHKIWRERVQVTSEAQAETEEKRERRRDMIVREAFGPPKRKSEDPSGIGPPLPSPSEVKDQVLEERWKKIQDLPV